jgi:hypothetical protein
VAQAEGTPQEERAPAPTPTETQPMPPPVTHTNVDIYATPHIEKPWYERMGYGLSVGGGVDDFAGDAFRGATEIGGSWDVRATVGTRLPVAFEGSYIGSAQTIHAFGIDNDNDATLMGNGLQGAARFNMTWNYPVQPFIYGGAAWRHYELNNSDFNVSEVNDSDDVFEVPVGVGVAGYVQGLMADVRAEYRGAWGDDLIPSLTNDDTNTIIGSMDRWGVAGNIGAEF